MKISPFVKTKSFYHEAADKFCVQHSFSKDEQEIGIARLPSLAVIKSFDETVISENINELNVNHFQHKAKVKNLFYEQISEIDEDVYTFVTKNASDIFANTFFVVENPLKFNESLYGAHLASGAQATVLVTSGEGKTILGWQDSKLHLLDNQLNLQHSGESLTYAGGLFLNQEAIEILKNVRVKLTRSTLNNSVVYIERVDVLDILNALETVHFVLV